MDDKIKEYEELKKMINDIKEKQVKFDLTLTNYINKTDKQDQELEELRNKYSSIDKQIEIIEYNMKTVKDDVKEIKTDIKSIINKPSVYWDKIILVLLTSGATVVANIIFNK